MRKILCLLFVVSNYICYGQNLIPNGDFEQYWGCPDDLAQIDSAKFWMNPSGGIGFLGSPDYYNACSSSLLVGVPDNSAGYQIAHSGDAYSGIIMFHPASTVREYIETPLSSPLVAGTCYLFEMYFNSAEVERRSTDDIAVYFSDTVVQGINNCLPLPFTPQLNNPTGNFPSMFNWSHVSLYYTAHGGENYLIIGNFKDDSSTTIITQNVNAPYILSYFLIDDVSLTPCAASGITNELNLGYKVSPNPFIEYISIESEQYLDNVDYSISDSFGREILNGKLSGKFTRVSMNKLAQGVYFLKIKELKKSIKLIKL
jgi:hypothetical protein